MSDRHNPEEMIEMYEWQGSYYTQEQAEALGLLEPEHNATAGFGEQGPITGHDWSAGKQEYAYEGQSSPHSQPDAAQFSQRTGADPAIALRALQAIEAGNKTMQESIVQLVTSQNGASHTSQLAPGLGQSIPLGYTQRYPGQGSGSDRVPQPVYDEEDSMPLYKPGQGLPVNDVVRARPGQDGVQHITSKRARGGINMRDVLSDQFGRHHAKRNAAVAVLAVGLCTAAFIASGEVSPDQAAAQVAASNKTQGDCYALGNAVVEGSGQLEWQVEVPGIETQAATPGASDSAEPSQISYPGRDAYAANARPELARLAMPLNLNNTFNAEVCLGGSATITRETAKTLTVAVDMSKIMYDGNFTNTFTYKPVVSTLPQGVTEAQFDAANPAMKWQQRLDIDRTVASAASAETVDRLAQAETLETISNNNTTCGQEVFERTKAVVQQHFETLASEEGRKLDMSMKGQLPALNSTITNVKDIAVNNEAKQVISADKKLVLDQATSTCKGFTE